MKRVLFLSLLMTVVLGTVCARLVWVLCRINTKPSLLPRDLSILYSELSISLDIDLKSVENYIAEKSGPIV